MLLMRGGAVVAGAASAAQALAALDREVPDVILSDVGLPGRDGYSLMREIRERTPGRGGSVPAVALTAYATADDREKAMAAGFQGYISKPAGPDALVALLAEVAGRAPSPQP